MIFALDNGQIGMIVVGIIFAVFLIVALVSLVRGLIADHKDRKYHNSVGMKLRSWQCAYADHETWSKQLADTEKYYARKLELLRTKVDAARTGCDLAERSYLSAVEANGATDA